MMPVGKDEGGCMQYRLHAPGRMAVQVIYYRTGDGRFITERPNGCDDGG